MKENIKIWTTNNDGWPPPHTKPEPIPGTGEPLLRYEVDIIVWNHIDLWEMPHWLQLSRVGKGGLQPGGYTEDILCTEARMEEFQDWAFKRSSIKISGIRPIDTSNPLLQL